MGLPVIAVVATALVGPAAPSHAAPVSVNRAPAAFLQGAATGLSDIKDISVGRDGKTYVLQSSSYSVFAAGARGNTAPLRTVTLTPGSGQSGFLITADADGYVTVVTNQTLSDAVVSVYGPGATGLAEPELQKTNAELGIQAPLDVTDVGDEVAFIDNESNTVPTYDLRAGTLTPTRTILAGSETGTRIFGPAAIESDRAGRIALSGADWASVFAPGATGDVAPVRYLSGSRTTMSGLSGTGSTGVALDDRGNLFFGSLTYSGLGPRDTRILRFGPGATGNLAPAAVLGGSRTGLDPISYFDVAPTGVITTVNLDNTTSLNLFAPIGPYSVPTKPGSLKVTGQKSATRRTVSWKAANANADVRVTGYAVKVVCGGKAKVSRTVAATVRSVPVALRAFKKGRCTATVSARNAVGAGPVARTSFVVRR